MGEKAMITTASFLSHLAHHVEACFKTERFEAFREESWSRFQALGLPSKSDPAFRFVSLKSLYAHSFELKQRSCPEKSSFEKAILPECKSSHLVFVDGCFSQGLSDVTALPSEIVLCSLEEGLISHGAFLRTTLKRAIREETDPFALLNLSLNEQGVFLYVPPELQIQAPLQILHLTTGNSCTITAPHLQLVLGSKSHLSCLLTSYQFDEASSHFTIPLLHITLEERAQLDLCNALFSAWKMESIRASLKKGAKLRSVNLTHGSLSTRQNYQVELKGEEAEVDLSGLAILDGSSAAHTHVLIEHQAERTRSMQLFKGVLKGLSRSSFSGKIYVRPEAQKTQAYQLHKTLLLSPHAQVVSEPNLEIGADDVKASHGSTIAKLDDKQLFYFNARGMDHELASSLLIEGFCKEILQNMHPRLSSC